MPHDCITCAIRGLTARTLQYRFYLESRRKFEMDRLTEKLARAAGVAPRQTAKIEARADAIIAREAVLEQHTDKAFAPHETLLDTAESGLDAVERALAVVSNGAPLQASGDSPEAPSTQPGGSGASTEPAPS
jgi:hypothetical protein